jgi:hypothetical protein
MLTAADKFDVIARTDIQALKTEARKIEEKQSKEERTAEENETGKTREEKELQHRHGANESDESNALGWEQ